MQVKVFESQDMATGLRMVRKELGPEALILSTRTIRNGKLGLIGKSVLEITAAVDDTRLTKKDKDDGRKVDSVPVSFAQKMYLQNEKTSEKPTDEFTGEDLGLRLEKIRSKIKAQPPQTLEMRPRAEDQTGVKNDIADLKKMVSTLAGEISRLKSPQLEPHNPGANDNKNYPAGVQLNDPLLTILLENGVSKETSETIAAFGRESLSFEDLSKKESLVSFLQNTIAGLVQVSPQQYHSSPEQKRVALVGPTGVGKTTTLAKIAAKQISEHASSIAFITIDTYRIAAVEQLKVYGEIMRLPVEVVISGSQLKDALLRHSDKDLILIDTAGRSPRDHLCIEELADFFKPEFNIEKNLVLSSVTRETELMDTIDTFSTLGIDKTIFTKIDECSNLGVLLNVQINNSSPLACIANGQRVPEDMLDIDRDVVSRLIIPSIEGSAS